MITRPSTKFLIYVKWMVADSESVFRLFVHLLKLCCIDKNAEVLYDVGYKEGARNLEILIESGQRIISS